MHSEISMTSKRIKVKNEWNKVSYIRGQKSTSQLYPEIAIDKSVISGMTQCNSTFEMDSQLSLMLEHKRKRAYLHTQTRANTLITHYQTFLTLSKRATISARMEKYNKHIDAHRSFLNEVFFTIKQIF